MISIYNSNCCVVAGFMLFTILDHVHSEEDQKCGPCTVLVAVQDVDGRQMIPRSGVKDNIGPGPGTLYNDTT